MRPNPYTPGAGDRPRVLVGREDQLGLAHSLRRQLEAGYAANCLVFTGLRGVGKTVLLKEIAKQLQGAGWLATYVQIRRNVSTDRAFADVARKAGGNLPPTGRLKAALSRLQERGGSIQVLGAGIGLGAAGGADGYTLFLDILEDLAEAAAGDHVGVALIVDELQSLREEPLGSLIEIVQQLRDRTPLGFIGGGLPYLPGYISKVATSTERFRFERTDFLVPADAQAAIVEPAELEAVSWEPSALAAVVGRAGGYPYFLQLFASEAWTAANRRDALFSSIVDDDVTAAIPVVERLIETGMYEARYEQLGPVQLQYVTAMVDLLDKDPAGRGTVRSGEVAESIGRTGSAASPARDALIRSGIVHAPDHGELSFSIPGFADYLRRRKNEHT